MNETDAVKKCTPLVRKLASKLSGQGVPFEDLVQEGLLAAALAFRKWSPEGGANVVTWARMPIEHAMLDEIRRTQKNRRGARVQFVSFDAIDRAPPNTQRWRDVVKLGLTLHDTIGAEDEHPDYAQNAALVRAVSLLTDRERKIIRFRYVEALTQDAVAKKIGTTGARVCQIEKAALKRLRELLEAAGASA